MLEVKCTHEHKCKHDNVRYCSDCDKVYCLVCGKEWIPNFYGTIAVSNGTFPVLDNSILNNT